MFFKPTPYIAMIVMLMAAHTSFGFQQPTSDNEPTIRAYELKHSDANAVINLISEVLGDRNMRMQVEVDTNRIFVFAEKEVHKEIADVIAQLDVRKENAEFVVFALKHQEADRLMQTLRNMFITGPETGLFFTVDARTNSLIVSSRKQDDLETLRDMISRLDVPEAAAPAKAPLQNCFAKFTWLVSQDEVAQDKKLAAPVGSLAQLADKLDSKGMLRSPVVFTQTHTLIQPSMSSNQRAYPFSNSSNQSLNGLNKSMRIEGHIVSEAEDLYQLDISVVFSPGNQELQTRVSIPKGHPVAFSVADIDGMSSAIVVEITDLD